MNFKYNIKRLRIENGLTQEELARSIGVSQSAVYLWENGKSEKLWRKTYDLVTV